jgi:3-deoxy-manno-octulosonate cytidylyltransferase (CMP-KDO synthetase)
MTTAVLIPARLASTRFPKKMLANLNGQPLIHHVFNKCWNFGYETYVLTDSQEIADILPKKRVIMTSTDHENGTSRCMEVIDEVLQYDRYINVQGDMPDVTAEMLMKIDIELKTFSDVATAYSTMDVNDRQNPNVVKMIHNRSRAHWFLRAPLSYGDRHLGIYGYNRIAKSYYNVSKKFVEEDTEKLEQLRWIQNGIKIGVVEVEFDGIEINTPEDLKLWEKTNT